MSNEYFNSVFLHDVDPDDSLIPTLSTSNHTVSDINLEQIEVMNVLEDLDPTKASGPNNIPIHVFKECAHSITPLLTCLFNKSLKQSTIPSE